MPATTTGAGRVWHPAIDAVGLVDPAGGQFQPHGLRKMAITVWLDAGVPIEEAAAWCGHKNVTVMYKHYKARRTETGGNTDRESRRHVAGSGRDTVAGTKERSSIG